MSTDTSKDAEKISALSKGCAYTMSAWHLTQAFRHTTYDHMGQAVMDLGLGVKMLAKAEAPEKAKADAKIIEDSPEVRDKKLVDDLVVYSRYVKGSYRKTDEELTQVANCTWNDVLERTREAAPGRPAFFVFKNDARGEVILCFRGTNSIPDALSDAGAYQDKFMNGRAHTGMTKANKWFNKNQKKKLLQHLRDTGHRRLVVTGHSLGAGTAALVTMTFVEDKDFKNIEVRGYAFAPPAAVSKELAGATGPGKAITSVVVGDDIVPRASLRSFENLRRRLKEYDYKRKAQEKVLPKCMVKANYKVYGFAKKMAKKAVSSTKPTKAVFNFVEHRLEERDKRVDKMEPLYPPGRLLHIARGESTSDDPAQLDAVHLIERDPIALEHIGLSDTMLKDHGMASYMAALSSVKAGL